MRLKQSERMICKEINHGAVARAMLRCATVSIIMIGLPIASYAGELSRTDIRTSTEWEATGCYEPYEPSFYVYDAASFNDAVDEYNQYISEVNDYISCVNMEADSDYKTLRKVLENSREEIVQEMINQAESTKWSLENQRPN